MSFGVCAASERQRHQLAFRQAEGDLTGKGKVVLTSTQKHSIISYLETGKAPKEYKHPKTKAAEWSRQYQLVYSSTEGTRTGPSFHLTRRPPASPLPLLSFQELFPILYEAHGHHLEVPNHPETRCTRGTEMHIKLKSRYGNITKPAITYFLRTCPRCCLLKENRQPGRTGHVQRRGGGRVTAGIPRPSQCLWTKLAPFVEVHVFPQPGGRAHIEQSQRTFQLARIAAGPFHARPAPAPGAAEGAVLAPCHGPDCLSEHEFLVELAAYAAAGGAHPEPVRLTTEQLAHSTRSGRALLQAYLNGRTASSCSVCGEMGAHLFGCVGCLRALCYACMCPCYRRRADALREATRPSFRCHLCLGSALPGTGGSAKSDYFFPAPGQAPRQRPLRGGSAALTTRRLAGTAALLARSGRAPHAYSAADGATSDVVALVGQQDPVHRRNWGTVIRREVDDGLCLLRLATSARLWVWANFAALAPRLSPLPAACPASDPDGSPPARACRPLSVHLENVGVCALEPFDHAQVRVEWCPRIRAPVVVGGMPGRVAPGAGVFVARRKVQNTVDEERGKLRDHKSPEDDRESEARDHIGRVVRIGVAQDNAPARWLRTEEDVRVLQLAWLARREAALAGGTPPDPASELEVELQWLSPGRDLENAIARPRDADGVLIGSPNCKRRLDRAALFETDDLAVVPLGTLRLDAFPWLVAREELMNDHVDGEQECSVDYRRHYFVAAKHYLDHESGCYVLEQFQTPSDTQTDNRQPRSLPLKGVDLCAGFAGACIGGLGGSAWVSSEELEVRQTQFTPRLLVDNSRVACESAVENLNSVTASNWTYYLLDPGESRVSRNTHIYNFQQPCFTPVHFAGNRPSCAVVVGSPSVLTRCAVCVYLWGIEANTKNTNNNKTKIKMTTQQDDVTGSPQDRGHARRKRARHHNKRAPVIHASIEKLLSLFDSSNKDVSQGREAHWQQVAREGLDDADILFFCPPCQAYSSMNRGNNKMKEATKEEREKIMKKNERNIRTLFECAKVVLLVQPQTWVFENVLGIIGHLDKEGPVLGRLIGMLGVGAGYNVSMKIVVAGDFSLPQERKRLIIMGCRTCHGVLKVPRPAIQRDVRVKHAIGDLDVTGQTPAYIAGELADAAMGYWTSCQRRELSPAMLDMFTDASTPLTYLPGQRIGWDERLSAITSCTDSDKYKVVHPKFDRLLSTRERLRCQGFPDNILLCGNQKERWLQAANALPGPLGYGLVGSCIELLLPSQPDGSMEVEESDQNVDTKVEESS